MTTTIANNRLIVTVIATRFILVGSYACLCNKSFSYRVAVLTNKYTENLPRQEQVWSRCVLHSIYYKKDPVCKKLRANGIPHIFLCTSLCNYFLQTPKNKRRPQNKFGVVAFFPRITTKRIPFAGNFVQMGSHMFSSAHRFATIFCRLQK